jgi:hypothetical protein
MAAQIISLPGGKAVAASAAARSLKVVTGLDGRDKQAGDRPLPWQLSMECQG